MRPLGFPREWNTISISIAFCVACINYHSTEEHGRVITNIFENKKLIKSLQTRVIELTTVNNHITPEQEKLFTSTLKQKQKLPKPNIIQAKNVCGWLFHLVFKGGLR